MADRTVAVTDTLETFRTTYNSTAGDVGDIASLTGASGTIASSTDIVEAVVAMNTEIAALKAGTSVFETKIVFEGDTDDAHETTLTITDPTADRTITLPDVTGTIALTSSDITGNAATATVLETARTIGGVSFNGSANINLPGVNSAGNQNTSGSAATLTTARTIGGTSFDGSANIAVALATLATTVTITDNESTNEDNALIFTAGGDVDGGNIGLESDGTLTYNPSTGKVTATGFVGSGDSLTGIESYSPRGLICSNDTDAAHDVAISVGGVRDATNVVNMTLSATLPT